MWSCILRSVCVCRFLGVMIPFGAPAPVISFPVFWFASLLSIRDGGRVGGAVAGKGGALSCWLKSQAEEGDVSRQRKGALDGSTHKDLGCKIQLPVNVSVKNGLFSLACLAYLWRGPCRIFKISVDGLLGVKVVCLQSRVSSTRNSRTEDIPSRTRLLDPV